MAKLSRNTILQGKILTTNSQIRCKLTGTHHSLFCFVLSCLCWVRRKSVMEWISIGFTFLSALTHERTNDVEVDFQFIHFILYWKFIHFIELNPSVQVDILIILIRNHNWKMSIKNSRMHTTTIGSYSAMRNNCKSHHFLLHPTYNFILLE